MSLTLRPYQVGAIDQLRAYVAAGILRLLLICPTGGGKTVIAAEMIRSAVARSKRVLFLAHRRELIDQCFDKLCRFGVNAGVLMGTDRRRDDYFPVQVASVQTLARRLEQLPPADVIFVDEAHHAISNSYRTIVDRYPHAIVIGLTATPWRLGKLSLAEVFEESVLAATPAELMAIGALTGYEAYAYDSPQLHDVSMVAGEFHQKELAEACNTSVLVGNVVHEYLIHGGGRRGILFPVDTAHSKSLIDEFARAGVPAAHLDCHTPKLQRQRILSDLESGALRVVASVGVLTEGFDCCPVEVIMLARPTQSLSLHLQMIGRGLRPSPSTGKQKALIHCHSGNVLRFGFPDDERDYSLTATPKRDRAMHTCPFCKFLFGSIRSDGKCPSCGELIALAVERAAAGEAAARASKVVVDGKRLSADQIRAARAMRAQSGLRNDLSDAQLVRVAHATSEEKAAEYLRLLDVAARRGFKAGFAAHAYRETFGVWPRFSDELLEHAQPAVSPFVPLPPKKRETEAA
jgi:DNA repair protein RadD